MASEDQTVSIKWGAFHKQLTLTTAQKDVLNRQDRLMIVNGGVGCGKTTVLMLKGLQWLQAGHDVIVCALNLSSMPGCRLVYQQLKQAYKEAQESLFPKDRTWGEVKWESIMLSNGLNAALSALTRHGNDLFVLMDNYSPEDELSERVMLDLFKGLRIRVPALHLWATEWFSRIPEVFKTCALTEPLRYPVPLQHDIALAVNLLSSSNRLPPSLGFTYSGVPERGPDVIHTRHKGSRDEDKWPINSRKCGRQVAGILRNTGVGETVGGATRYQYRDVLVVCRNVVSPDLPPPAFVTALEASGVPTQIFAKAKNTNSLEEAFDHLILANENKVTVLNRAAARGLERRVVVCLTGEGPDEHWQLTEQELQVIMEGREKVQELAPGLFNTTTSIALPSKAHCREQKEVRLRRLRAEMELKHRLSIWSLCSHQLVVVHLPKSIEGDTPGSGPTGRKCVIL